MGLTGKQKYGTQNVKEQGVAEGKLVESAVFLNPTTVVVGQAHGQPLELSPNTLKQIQAIAAKHGAWYEGNGTDRGYTKGQIDKYVGSWDDEVAKTANSNDPKWLYVLFANVDENNRVQRVGVDPNDTIFNRLLATAKDNSFQGIGYTSQALQKFLQMASEGKYDFVKMSQQPATQENLTRFLKAGEALMWPSNWEQYPNKAGKIAKAATVDVRDQYLATRKAGVYVTGSGHLKAVQNITGKQGVDENFADGKNPGRKGLAKRVGVNCKQPESKLRSIAKNSSGERQRMAHWCANMKSGKKK
jgi:phage gp37-like protein